MLELESFFNDELTGRENVYFFGMVLGFDRKTVSKMMNEIEDLAEIGDYMDEVVRVYSTGMLMRLAFSAYVACKPDILVIDEALGVGDTKFQRRAWKILEDMKKAGTTLVIVSHSPQVIEKYCDSVILLDAGEFILRDQPRRAMGVYRKRLSKSESARELEKPDDPVEQALLYGAFSEVAAIHGALGQIVLFQAGTSGASTMASGDLLHLYMHAPNFCEEDIFCVSVRKIDGTLVFQTDKFLATNQFYYFETTQGVVVRLSLQMRLKQDIYSLDVTVGSHDNPSTSPPTEMVLSGRHVFDGLGDIGVAIGDTVSDGHE